MPDGDVPISDEKIRSVLSAYTKAIDLYEKVIAYYGNTITIMELIPDEIHNSAGIVTDAAGQFRNAYAEVKIDSTRAAAGLVHELLHLDLWGRGFPILRRYDCDTKAKFHYCGHLIGEVLNVINHELFYREFLSVGFQPHEFLGDGDVLNVDQEQLEIERGQKAGVPSDILQVKFNSKYFRFWITNRHTNQTSDADSYLAMATRFWPTAGATANTMREWIDRGEYRDFKKFAFAVSQLFEAMGMPRAHFQVLEKTAIGLSFRPID